MEAQPVVVYFELLEMMKAFLKVRFPGKVVSTEIDDDGVAQALVVHGVGEHNMVRYSLEYENHTLGKS